ncbi:MAG: nucleotide exchange factor GrpE [Chloroflexota bacterium]|nr:nucleotide exchange factor GrpE [Chloroflexota bacterium]
MTKKEDEKDRAETVEEEVETATETSEETGEEPGEEVDVQEQLEKAEAQAAEYLDGWQRTQAEFSNYKKRQETERAQMRARASADVLRKLLPVTDDFERALSTLPIEFNKLTWSEGILLIKYKLDAILKSEGVEPIETDGQAFDPRYHEAVTHEEAAGYEEGHIIGEVQKGYTLGERVLRPASVRVAKAPAAQPEEDEDENNDTSEDKE